MPLSELDINEVGRSIQLAGAVYTQAGTDKVWLLLLPGQEPIEAVGSTSLNDDEWSTFLRQTDLVEVEADVKEPDGKVVRAIVRKCERQVSQIVSWMVYRRDDFQCRYCGADAVPLTVDHLVTWESGGPSIPENLLSSCKDCNNARGDMPYAEWLRSPYFKRVSQAISHGERFALQAITPTLADIPRMPITRKRKKKGRRR